jgi:hypothetical protein
MQGSLNPALMPFPRFSDLRVIHPEHSALAHAAGANRRHDLVMGERRADQFGPPASHEVAKRGVDCEE